MDIERYRRSLFPISLSSDVFQFLTLQTWFQSAKTVAVYISQDFEFPTAELFLFCNRHRKKIAAPVVDKNSMEFRRIEKWENTVTNGQNISEPTFGAVVPADRIDVFFVPLVGFDSNGARLGRGGGYFDRLFSDPFVTGVKVGLGFEFQFCLSIPSESHDVCMDYVLTEKNLRKIL